MIDVSMTSPTGVTLDTAGKYCADAVRVTPAFDFAEKARRWIVTLVGTQPSVNGIMVSDPWLAAHWNDEDLCVSLTKVSGDMTANSVVGNVQSNGICMIGQNYGYRSVVESYGADQSAPLCEVTSGAGYVGLSSNGVLTYYNGSGIRYRDGVYSVIAWLARNGV